MTAQPMTQMYFGKYKGTMIDDVPTDYLVWVFGSFPKLRNKLRLVLEGRGLSPDQISHLSSRHKVLSKNPVSAAKRRQKLLKPKRVRRTDAQNRANDAARAIGQEIPFPRYQIPRELRYFARSRQPPEPTNMPSCSAETNESPTLY
jgi:hypothetical protein